VKVQRSCLSIGSSDQHGLPVSIVSDRDPRFTGKFWDAVFKVLGTKLDMSTADHPQTDGQTERVNRVVEDILRSICAETPKRWSAMLPLVEFALNNAVHASTGCTPFYVNGLTHPRVPLTLPLRGSGLGGGEIADRLADVRPLTVRKQVRIRRRTCPRVRGGCERSAPDATFGGSAESTGSWTPE
jgi:transposase InsO family protein